MVRVDYIIQNRDGSFCCQAGYKQPVEFWCTVDVAQAIGFDTVHDARAAMHGWLRNRTTYPTVVKRTITIESV